MAYCCNESLNLSQSYELAIVKLNELFTLTTKNTDITEELRQINIELCRLKCNHGARELVDTNATVHQSIKHLMNWYFFVYSSFLDKNQIERVLTILSSYENYEHWEEIGKYMAYIIEEHLRGNFSNYYPKSGIKYDGLKQKSLDEIMTDARTLCDMYEEIFSKKVMFEKLIDDTTKLLELFKYDLVCIDFVRTKKFAELKEYQRQHIENIFNELGDDETVPIIAPCSKMKSEINEHDYELFVNDIPFYESFDNYKLVKKKDMTETQIHEYIMAHLRVIFKRGDDYEECKKRAYEDGKKKFDQDDNKLYEIPFDNSGSLTNKEREQLIESNKIHYKLNRRMDLFNASNDKMFNIPGYTKKKKDMTIEDKEEFINNSIIDFASKPESDLNYYIQMLEERDESADCIQKLELINSLNVRD